MNLHTAKSPTGSKMAHRNLHHQAQSDNVWCKQEKTPHTLSLLGGRVECTSNIPAFWETAQGTITSVSSPLNQRAD